MLMTIVVLGAAILVFTIHRKGDFKFNMRWLGANVSLEAKDVARKWPDDETDSRF
jgi:hypothetical protein